MVEKFSFGKNWQRYIKIYFNEEIINEAKKSLLSYHPEDYYKDKVFIDIGCGSGIFSLAALMLGCKEVYSLDVDENSVEATTFLKNKFIDLIKENNKKNMTTNLNVKRMMRRLNRRNRTKLNKRKRAPKVTNQNRA